MPIYEYECEKHGRITKFFPSFSAAKEHEERTMCGIQQCDETICEKTAERIVSAPLPAMFFGNPEGYAKPSTLKRHSTKVVSQKDGNSSAAG